MNDLLRLAVVGHTNTGKTSLLQTLLEDNAFGEVKDEAGTTRHVEGARIRMNQQGSIELYDTPGLEDGIGLHDYVDQLIHGYHQRITGPESVRLFLDSPESSKRFEQEARVLKKLLGCDAGLYVVDIRDPVLSKHKDELAILARCGKPLIAILNFMHSEKNHIEQWRMALSELGLHMHIEFDTVAPALDGKEQLYKKLALVLGQHSHALMVLSASIKEQRALRKKIAFTMMAALLIDVAAFKLSVDTNSDSKHTQWASLQQAIREREHQFIHHLLKHYRFSPHDYADNPLPIKGERWGMDLFNPKALADMGVHLGKGFAAGAMVGATIDMFTAGLSLGAAALLGGVVGSAWQGADKFGKRLINRIQGYEELSVDDAVIRLLALRSIQLIHALEHRGHAAQQRIVLEDVCVSDTASNKAELSDIGVSIDRISTDKLPEPIQQARMHVEWSMLGKNAEKSNERESAINQLVSYFLNDSER